MTKESPNKKNKRKMEKISKKRRSITEMRICWHVNFEDDTGAKAGNVPTEVRLSLHLIEVHKANDGTQ